MGEDSISRMRRRDADVLGHDRWFHVPCLENVDMSRHSKNLGRKTCSTGKGTKLMGRTNFN
jgi:hypothetical protein